MLRLQFKRTQKSKLQQISFYCHRKIVFYDNEKPITFRNDKTKIFKIFSLFSACQIFFFFQFGSLVGTLNHRFYIVPLFLFITPNLVLHNRQSNTSLEQYILEIKEGREISESKEQNEIKKNDFTPHPPFFFVNSRTSERKKTHTHSYKDL